MRRYDVIYKTIMKTYRNAVREGLTKKTQNLVKFGRVVFELCESGLTAGQTYLSQYFAPLPGAK